MTTEEKAIEQAHSKILSSIISMRGDKSSKDCEIEVREILRDFAIGFHNSQPPNLDLINQITQLTKERDEWIRTSQNMSLIMTDLNNELQAAKDRIKELENGC